MRRFTILYFLTGLLALAFIREAAAQNVGINNAGLAPNAAAILDLSTGSAGNQGLLIPRMSDIERKNIKSPIAGLMIYDTTLQQLVIYNGTGWQGISANAVSTSIGAGTASGPNIAINTNGSKADPSAVLDVASTDKGMLIPRVASSSSVTSVNGLIIYNMSTSAFNFYNGSSWVAPCQSLIDNHTSTGATAQGVAINATGATADPSAILDVSSTNKGLLIPELASSQRDMFPSPARGLLIYDKDDGDIEYWTGTAWNALANASWNQLSYSGTTPPNREAQCAVWDSADGIMLMFGGDEAVSGTVYNDLWSYKPSTNTWTLLTANGASGSPAARSTPCGVWDNIDNELLVFSGESSCGGISPWFNDVWAYSPSLGTWKNMNPAGKKPSTRFSSSAVWDPTDKEMIIYAGAGNPHMDLWAYSPSTNTWDSLSIAGGPTFARDSYQGVWDPTDHLMWVFGGNCLGTIFDDLWSYSPSTATWKQYTITQPAGRGYYTAVWDPVTQSVLLFGGWNWTTLYGDMWSYSPAANQWTEITPCGTTPSARGGDSSVWDLTNNTMYLYGGSSQRPKQCVSNAALGDSWHY